MVAATTQSTISFAFEKPFEAEIPLATSELILQNTLHSMKTEHKTVLTTTMGKLFIKLSKVIEVELFYVKGVLKKVTILTLNNLIKLILNNYPWNISMKKLSKVIEVELFYVKGVRKKGTILTLNNLIKLILNNYPWKISMKNCTKQLTVM